MTDKKHSSWMNKATFCIKRDMFDAFDLDAFWTESEDEDTEESVISAFDLGKILKKYAEKEIKKTSSGFPRDYALAFIADVNWSQIAQSMIDDYHDYYEYTHG